MNKNKLNSAPIFQAFSYTVVAIVAILCLLPFIVLISGSISDEGQVLAKGYSFIPRGFSLDAYAFIFRNPAELLSAYRVSIIVAVVGTVLSLLISTMAAYVMYRKEVKYRNKLAFFLFFTTLFSGGLAPFFIWVTSYLHLKNTLAVLILLPMFNVMYVLILRSFIKGSVPEPLVESAKIDGAGDFRIFWQMVLPLCKPALASIGLFTILAYWNDWWTPMMFTDKQEYVPLQYMLYKMLSSMNMSAALAQHVSSLEMPKETFKLAMTVIATGPVVILFPFLQQYFVKGITIGAVKG
ncbi:MULTISPECIES: carbohydrate ABC transporter permease [Paenibacillus]|uniref:Aldouronate transport system permease protein n=1 Tax=Paenibacillus amylolyticus TaxID=1451 RepID=A0AAP5GWJ0_PAEAM|nr:MULTISPECIES: carbohydrate ABC transporter permease [Paenibacillus]KQY94385.1 sugar ABC transporter permease [Paenibacillus sp. Root52]MDR6721632.1 putative aldouronate transport system permease protein [Paenibacillus amylolyticus]